MRVSGRENLHTISTTELAEEAGRWGYPPARAHRVALSLIERVCDAAASPRVPDNVRTLVQGRARSLLSREQRSATELPRGRAT